MKRSALILLGTAAVLVLTGCGYGYYRLTDRDTGSVYYTSEQHVRWSLEPWQSVRFTDRRTGEQTTLWHPKIQGISRSEYEGAIAAGKILLDTQARGFTHEIESPPIASYADVAALVAEGAVFKEAHRQELRYEFMEHMIALGVFYKIEMPGVLPRLWVTPQFHSLDFETKKEFVSVVYAYYVTANADLELVALYDSQSGKQIGSYSVFWGYGLQLD